MNYVLLLLAIIVPLAFTEATPIQQGDVDPVEWPLLHRDLRNSKWQPLAGPRILVPAWSALEGKPITTFVAAGSNDVLYALSMDTGPCHLHAFNKQGNLLWCSSQVRTLYSSLAVSDDGALFVTDGTEVFRFEADGTIRWRIPATGPALAVGFTSGKHLLIMDYQAITTVYDPVTGAAVAGPFALPVGTFPRPSPLPRSIRLLQRGLPLIGMDPVFVDTFIDAYGGYNTAVGNNAPAVHPETGRIFIAVPADPTKTTGLLYGIDFIPPGNGQPASLTIGCSARMGVGTSTSPAISQDGTHVYAGDQGGTLYAFKTADCRVAWSLPLGGSAMASPTAGPDGRLYMLIAGKIVAIQDNGESGQELWRLDIAGLAQLEGYATGRFVSTLPLTQTYLYSAATYFTTAMVPMKHVLATIDPVTGALVGVADLGEESDSAVSLGTDGTVYVATKPLAKASALANPATRNLTPPPHSGFYAFAPASCKELVADGLWVAFDFILAAEAAWAAGEDEKVMAQVEYALNQLGVVQDNLTRAADREEISVKTVNQVRVLVGIAAKCLKHDKIKSATSDYCVGYHNL